MASWLFSSLQTLSGKLLGAIRGSEDQEPNKTKSIEEDLKWLSRMLERIEAVQQDAEEREIHDRSVALWLRELRGVAHEAEDVLDEFHYEVLKSIVENRDTANSVENTDTVMTTSNRGTKRRLEEIFTSSLHASSSSSVAKIIIPDGMADTIKKIRERFDEICMDRENLRLREDEGLRRISGPKCRPPSSSHIDEKGLFGRENEKEQILSRLNVENNVDFMVVPIVGKGGLGKTTLAQLVYNDPKVYQLFDKKAWVSVSDDFDLVRLTKATIESISNNPCLFSELSKLQDILKEKLNGIKLFLVLDDIWNEEKNLWESFKIVFTGAKTVRILITTRSQSIAKIMQTTPPFELAQLHEDKCWMLFKHCVFGNQEENEHADLLEIGRHIVKKCNGLPLAVKVLGGLLGYEKSEEKWKDVLESDTWIVDEKEEIMRTLSLSYHHMPLHLRPCFLYLSMFPKDKLFEKEEVIRLWMAQGYINSRPNKTLEDIGGEYFEELQCRSLIDSHQFGAYVLHDLIHDLARSINEKIYPKSTNDKPSDGSSHAHHLYLNEPNELLNYITTNNAKFIRTLWNYNLHDISDISSGSDDIQIDSPIIFSAVSLRVLKLKACILPDDIGVLKHLRYLNISGEELEYFPKELCLLYNLQTLNVDCPSLRELPSDIGNLMNLRCLKLFSDKLKKLPNSISYLCNLQILDLNVKEIDMLSSRIEQLTNLRTLMLPYSDIGLPRGLGKLTRLQTIEGTLSFKGDAMQGGLGEFKLIDLRGSLCIEGIENITDVEYTREANIKSKSNLEYLELNFSIKCGYQFYRPTLHLIINKPISMGHSTSMKDIQESVLDSLQPHGNIKDIKILNYGGTQWPSWISDPLQMSKLSRLCLFCDNECEYKCMCLPSLGRLPSLKFLDINGLGVEKIGNEFCRESDSSSNNAFPSLEKLVFSRMTKWEDWIGVLDGDFPYLTKLSINRCRKLRKLPTLGRLQSLKFMDIKDLGVENIGNEFCRESDSSSNNAFPSLEKLVFSEMHKWEDWIGMLDGDFPCLKELSIEGCRNLRKLPMLGRLPSLKFLTLSGVGVEKIGNEFCRESDSSSNNAFPSLEKLRFYNMPEWEDWIGVLDGDFPCLKELFINRCPNLRKLPTLGRLPSLKVLVINNLGVEKIGNEFCRESDSFSNNAFPSLEKLVFSDMPTWEDWIGVLDGDFPCLKELSIEGCRNLRKLPMLGRLPSLKFLTLSGVGVEKIGNEFCRESDSSSNNAFPSLEKLRFYNMPEWEDWIGVLDGDFPCLIELSIKRCPNLRKLPTLGRLPSLKFLDIKDLGVEKIGNEFCRESDSSSNNAFPSLEKLVFSCMYKWEDWIGVLDGDFPCLKELSIEECLKLRKLPTLGWLPSLKFLDIKDLGVEKIGNEFCRESDSSSNNAFPSLEKLVSSCMYKWEDWIGVLDGDFPCLKELSIKWCRNLRKLPTITIELEKLEIDECGFHEIQLPVSLYVKIVKISYCRELTLVMGLNNYKSLTELTIEYCPLLKISLDSFLLVTLEYLEVSRCHELITIPPLGEDSALREIRISGCPKLSVIEGLHLLSSLKTLILEDCQELRVLPCEKLQIGIQAVRICNCPLAMDWCQLNGFPENKISSNMPSSYFIYRDSNFN